MKTPLPADLETLVCVTVLSERNVARAYRATKQDAARLGIACRLSLATFRRHARRLRANAATVGVIIWRNSSLETQNS
jgi:hypothetical protein